MHRSDKRFQKFKLMIEQAQIIGEQDEEILRKQKLTEFIQKRNKMKGSQKDKDLADLMKTTGHDE